MESGGNAANLTEKLLLRMRAGQTVDVTAQAGADTRGNDKTSGYTVRFVSSNPGMQVSDKLDSGITAKAGPAVAVRDEVILPGHRLWKVIDDVRKTAFPVILCLAIVLAMAFGLIYTFNTFSFSFGAVPCTLSSVNGIVAIQTPESASKTGSIGMELSAGARIKTAAGSMALLTFLDGSTLKMGPETEIEIIQLDFSDEQAVAIIIKQQVGSTWSSVEKMAGTASRYEIVTPTASALVHGTRFSIEVDAAGKTTEHTAQGLVSVKAQGEEVFVPPGQSTHVESGSGPAAPQEAPPPEEPEEQITQQSSAAQTRRYTPPAFGPGVNSIAENTNVNNAEVGGQGGSPVNGQDNTDNGQGQEKDKNSNSENPGIDNSNSGGQPGNSGDDKEKKNEGNNGKDNAGNDNLDNNSGNSSQGNSGGNRNDGNNNNQGNSGNPGNGNTNDNGSNQGNNGQGQGNDNSNGNNNQGNNGNSSSNNGNNSGGGNNSGQGQGNSDNNGGENGNGGGNQGNDDNNSQGQGDENTGQGGGDNGNHGGDGGDGGSGGNSGQDNGGGNDKDKDKDKAK